MPIHCDTVRDLIRVGARPIVLGLLGDGLTKTADIREVLLEEYDIEVQPQALAHFIRRLGERDELQLVGKKKDVLMLQQMAIEQLHHFKNKYEEAENSNDLQKMKFYAMQFDSWYDKVGRHFVTKTEPTTAVTVNNNFAKIDLTRVVIEETKGAPEVAKRIIERLRQGETIDLSVRDENLRSD